MPQRYVYRELLEPASIDRVLISDLSVQHYTKLCTKLCTKLYAKLCTKLYTKLLYKALHEALHKALHKALRIEALHKALREALCTEALHEASHRVPAIFPIASTRASAKYTPYIHLGSHLLFYPSFLTSSLPRGTLERQPADDRRQSRTTVAGAGRLSLELDDRRQSRPSSELDNRRQS